MKFQEKLQYKIRNYLYTKDRERLNKKQVKGRNPQKMGDKTQDSGEGILGFFEEMDDYLGKKVESITNKNK